MKKKFIVFSFCLCLIFGCSTPNPKTIQTLRVSFSNDPPTLDPRKGGDPISSTVQFMLFEGLTRMSEKSSSEPALAKKIDISEDKLTYIFHLRETLWSDGTPVTASDFESAWKAMMTPGFPCPNANLLYSIKNAKAAKEGKIPLGEMGVRALNPLTLEVKLETPTPYFLELISFCVFSPIPHKIAENHPDWADKLNVHFVTNGPFILKTWKKADQMILEKNPLYWEVDQVHLEKINVSFIDNEITAQLLYESGQLDILGGPFSSIPTESMVELHTKGQLETKPLGATTFCSFNLSRHPFTNVSIRKAFAHAINRRDIVEHLTELDETVATGPIPPIMKFQVNRTFFSDGDSQKALSYFEQGMEELGIQSLSELTFIYPQGELAKKIAQTLQHEWQQTLGIRLRIESYDTKTYFNKLVNRDYDLAYGFWVIQYNDVMNIFDRFKFKDNPKNYPGWENEEYIEILDRSMKIDNQKKRIKFLERAEEIMIEEMPLAPIFHWNNNFLKQPYLKDVHISPIGSIHLGKASIAKRVYEK